MTQRRSVYRGLVSGVVCAGIGMFGVAIIAVAPSGHADPSSETTDQPDKVWAYQWNTFMGSFNFASPDEALSYGYGICDKVAQGRPFGQLMADVRSDLDTPDGALYLITQAVNELCPALIPQLRSSAAHYRG